MHRTTAVTAAASTGLAAAAALMLAAPAIAGADVSRASGEVTRYPGQEPVADAPAGAAARVHSVATPDGRTIVTLGVTGFAPSSTYGAHAHVAPCGDPAADPKGVAAGGHYQHVEPGEGERPTDAAFANPVNEVWLDVTTDRAGQGRAKAVVDWQFRPAPGGRSVIIHEMGTTTIGGKHGVAGKRVACIDVAF
jgi:superoxide dismutase, Cu-Zn family